MSSMTFLSMCDILMSSTCHAIVHYLSLMCFICHNLGHNHWAWTPILSLFWTVIALAPWGVPHFPFSLSPSFGSWLQVGVAWVLPSYLIVDHLATWWTYVPLSRSLSWVLSCCFIQSSICGLLQLTVCPSLSLCWFVPCSFVTVHWCHSLLCVILQVLHFKFKFLCLQVYCHIHHQLYFCIHRLCCHFHFLYCCHLQVNCRLRC